MSEFEKNLEREIIRTKNNTGTLILRLNEISIREIFETKHEVNLLKDEKGMPIPGTGRLITKEEKKMVFDYILDKELPLTTNIYNTVLKGYIDGDLILEPKEEKSRKL